MFEEESEGDGLKLSKQEEQAKILKLFKIIDREEQDIKKKDPYDSIKSYIKNFENLDACANELGFIFQMNSLVDYQTIVLKIMNNIRTVFQKIAKSQLPKTGEFWNNEDKELIENLKLENNRFQDNVADKTSAREQTKVFTDSANTTQIAHQNSQAKLQKVNSMSTNDIRALASTTATIETEACNTQRKLIQNSSSTQFFGTKQFQGQLGGIVLQTENLIDQQNEYMMQGQTTYTPFETARNRDDVAMQSTQYTTMGFSSANRKIKKTRVDTRPKYFCDKQTDTEEDLRKANQSYQSREKERMIQYLLMENELNQKELTRFISNRDEIDSKKYSGVSGHLLEMVQTIQKKTQSINQEKELTFIEKHNPDPLQHPQTDNIKYFILEDGRAVQKETAKVIFNHINKILKDRQSRINSLVVDSPQRRTSKLSKVQNEQRQLKDKISFLENKIAQQAMTYEERQEELKELKFKLDYSEKNNKQLNEELIVKYQLQLNSDKERKKMIDDIQHKIQEIKNLNILKDELNAKLQKQIELGTKAQNKATHFESENQQANIIIYQSFQKNYIQTRKLRELIENLKKLLYSKSTGAIDQNDLNQIVSLMEAAHENGSEDQKKEFRQFTQFIFTDDGDDKEGGSNLTAAQKQERIKQQLNQLKSKTMFQGRKSQLDSSKGLQGFKEGGNNNQDRSKSPSRKQLDSEELDDNANEEGNQDQQDQNQYEEIIVTGENGEIIKTLKSKSQYSDNSGKGSKKKSKVQLSKEKQTSQFAQESDQLNKSRTGSFEKQQQQKLTSISTGNQDSSDIQRQQGSLKSPSQTSKGISGFQDSSKVYDGTGLLTKFQNSNNLFVPQVNTIGSGSSNNGEQYNQKGQDQAAGVKDGGISTNSNHQRYQSQGSLITVNKDGEETQDQTLNNKINVTHSQKSSMGTFSNFQKDANDNTKCQIMHSQQQTQTDIFLIWNLFEQYMKKSNISKDIIDKLMTEVAENNNDILAALKNNTIPVVPGQDKILETNKGGDGGTNNANGKNGANNVNVTNQKDGKSGNGNGGKASDGSQGNTNNAPNTLHSRKNSRTIINAEEAKKGQQQLTDRAGQLSSVEKQGLLSKKDEELLLLFSSGKDEGNQDDDEFGDQQLEVLDDKNLNQESTIKKIYLQVKKKNSPGSQEVRELIRRYFDKEGDGYVTYEEFKTYFNKTLTIHQRCGELCPHLKRFFAKVGFTTLKYLRRRELKPSKQKLNPFQNDQQQKLSLSQSQSQFPKLTKL